MSRYILDTNILEWLSDRAHPHHEPCRRALAALGDEEDVFIPILAAYEMQYGIANFPQEAVLQRQQASQALDSFASLFPVANLSLSGSRIFGELKARYKNASNISKANLKKLNFDILLASISIDHDAILVSNDAVFTVLTGLDPRLHTVDWTI